MQGSHGHRDLGIDRVRNLWSTLRPSGPLARDTLLLTTGIGMRALLQALVFIIVARVLGPNGYGSFIAVLAIASILSPLVGVGGHVLLARDISRNPASFRLAWGTALALLIISLPVIGTLYLLLAFLLLGPHLWLPILLIGVAELVFWPLANVCAYAYQGFERMGRMSRLLLVPVAMRALAAIILLMMHALGGINDMVELWAFLYMLAAAIAAAVAQSHVRHDLGIPRVPSASRLRTGFGDGAPFVVSGFSQRMYSDADKVMLTSMVSPSVAGLYSAGHRFVDLSQIPLYGLLNALTPRLFRSGTGGPAQTLRLLLKAAPWPAAYLILVAAALWLAAPLVTIVLGNAYEETIPVIRWMSLLPLFSLPRWLLHYALATSGLQRIAMNCFIAAAAANVLLNLWWIPMYGWHGALTATYVSELLAALLMLSYLASARRRD